MFTHNFDFQILFFKKKQNLNFIFETNFNQILFDFVHHELLLFFKLFFLQKYTKGGCWDLGTAKVLAGITRGKHS